MSKKNVTKKKPATTKGTGLYYKGKKLNKEFTGVVEKVAQIKKENVSTPAKLKRFYEENKDTFGILFDVGLETGLAGSSKVFNQFETAESNNHNFFIKESGETKEISANRAKFELAKLEQHLNTIFGSTGVEFSYKVKLDKSITIEIPDEEELEALQDEPVEFINDYLSNYGVKMYTSDESKKKKYLDNEPKRKSYSDRVTKRFKEFRKEYNAEKRRSAKSKTKRKKRY
jgi:hypothetical protein